MGARLHCCSFQLIKQALCLKTRLIKYKRCRFLLDTLNCEAISYDWEIKSDVVENDWLEYCNEVCMSESLDI